LVKFDIDLYLSTVSISVISSIYSIILHPNADFNF